MSDNRIVGGRPVEVKLQKSESDFVRTGSADGTAHQGRRSECDVAENEPDEMHKKVWSKFVRCRKLVAVPPTYFRIFVLIQVNRLVLMVHLQSTIDLQFVRVSETGSLMFNR